LKHNVIHIFWYQVYQLLKKKSDATNDAVNFIKEQFKGLMEVENMRPYNGINRDMMDSYVKFLDNIVKLFDEVKKKSDVNCKTKFTFGKGYISHNFDLNGKKYLLSFNCKDKRFTFGINSWVVKLSKTQEEKLEKEFGKKQSWYYEVLENDSFFERSKDEQIKLLTEFFKKQLDRFERTLL